MKVTKTRQEKAITLIALIITIVVLLILAVVAINSIQNDGILSKADQAANKYNESVQNEVDELQNYLDFLNQYAGGSVTGSQYETATTVANAKTSGKPYQNNTTIIDDFGNQVKVPAGFKIAEDSATDVTGGVVIEDATYENTIGSQFVWIPTGNIKTSPTDTEGTEIKLARYTFNLGEQTGPSTFSGTGAVTGTYEPDDEEQTIDSKYEELASSETCLNAKALSLTNFLNSAKPISEGGNGGYYIGRYEAGVTGYDETATNSNTQTSGDTEWTKYVTAAGGRPQIVCKDGVKVWDTITQKEASNISRAMYNTNSNFTSDLVNSYAWDTAIVFIQKFGKNADGTPVGDSYSISNKSTKYAEAGENGDEYCKINDMSENAVEWTTETYSDAEAPCVCRGGFSVANFAFGCTSFRSLRWTGSCRQQRRSRFLPPTFICRTVSCERSFIARQNKI